MFNYLNSLLTKRQKQFMKIVKLFDDYLQMAADANQMTREEYAAIYLSERNLDIKNESLEINEAKVIDRDEMIKWIQQYMKFVKTTEEFDGSTGGIWVSGENMDLFKGKRIYDYYNETRAYDLGVLSSWEKELDKRGWYSEWYDAGTVMIWQN